MNASPPGSKPDVTREEIRDLSDELHHLQQRVSALERREPGHIAQAPPVLALLPRLPFGPEFSSNAVPAIGRALLTVAGAYLLRALTELNVLPVKVGVAAGILYAFFWLWRATRAEGEIAATVTVLSSVVIFAPLLWEATTRFHAVSTWTAAAVVAVFSLAAIGQRRIAIWSCTAGAAVAIALLIGTEDLVPFTIALLAIAAGAELAAISRWFVALCTDASILFLIQLLGRDAGLPEGYAPIPLRAAMAMLVLLLLIYIGSAAVRTLIRARTFTAYEIAQSACAFILAIGGALYLTNASQSLGWFALVAGVLCYAIALTTRVSGRNIQTYAAFGGLLVIAGTWLLLSGASLVAAWAAMAIALSWTAFASVHVPAFLWLAAAISGLAVSSATQLFTGETGSFPAGAATMIIIAAAVSYFRILQADKPWPALLIAAVFVWSASGLAASLGAGAFVLVFSAMALAWSGRRWHRPDLIWLMYVVMILAGGKILVRDFSRETTMTLVVSLLLYGATLILLPRILKKS